MRFVTPQAKPTMNVLLYGPPKSGKTIGACTAPGGLLLLNADIGNASRQAHLRNPNGRILEVELPPFDKNNRTALYDLLGEIAMEISTPGQTMVQSVVVDPIGELHRRLLEEASGRAIRPKRDFYGDVGVHVERFCRFLCELPSINVVIVCHELGLENDGTVEKIAFTGTKGGSETLSAKLMGMVDVVAYSGMVEREDGTKDYVAQLIPAQGRNGGDRFACLDRGDGYRTVNIAEWLHDVEEYEKALVPGKLPPPVAGSLSVNVETQPTAEGSGELKLDFRRQKRSQAAKA